MLLTLTQLMLQLNCKQKDVTLWIHAHGHKKPLQINIYKDGNDVKQDFVFICIMCNAPLPQGLTISDVV